MSNTKVAQQIYSHPDFSEVMAKMTMDISLKDIHEWLKAKYGEQKELLIPLKNLKIFKEEYLDFYGTVRTDLLTVQLSLANQDDEDSAIDKVKGNAVYQKKLEEYLDKEIDIKTVIAKLIAKIEIRSEALYDTISNDPRNIKLDRTLIDYLNLLFQVCEKYNAIYNPVDQINIQNNNTVNINLIDSHINMMYDIIRSILTQLDYESSLLFTELFTKRLSELKLENTPILSPEKRLEAAYTISSEVQDKLNT